MAYLPKNKYKVLYTNGDKYKLEDTGQPYTGEYIKTVEGDLYAGKDPSDLKGKLISLDVLRSKNILTNHRNNRIYQLLDRDRAKIQDNYIPIPSSNPLPTAKDYNNGYYNRYLSVRLNTKKYQEISGDVYKKFRERSYNKSLNKVFFIKWDLTNNSEEINTKTLRNLESALPGIFDFFPFKGEYRSRNGVVNISPGTRIYIDGEVIDKNLPAAYQLGNKNHNSIENASVPNNQHCGNCIFNKQGYCERWEAKIKNEFWCRAHKIDSPVDRIGGSY